MANLEYKLGKIEIDMEKFRYFGEDPGESQHKFLVVGNGGTIYAYIAPVGHVKIVKNNSLENGRVLGGGSIYVNREGDLVLNHLSYIYGAVPNNIACKFAKLIQKELKKLGLKGIKVIVNPKKDLSSRWSEYGYQDKSK